MEIDLTCKNLKIEMPVKESQGNCLPADRQYANSNAAPFQIWENDEKLSNTARD